MAVTAALLGAAAIGAIGGVAGGKSAKKMSKKQRKDVREATRPSTVAEFNRQLMPLLRQQIIASQGPQFKQQLAGILSKRGLTGTGIGTALQAAAASAPGIFAMQQSLPLTMELLGRRVGMQSNYQVVQPPLISGLTGAAAGYFGAKSLQNNQQQTQQSTGGGQQSMSALFPGLEGGMM